MKLNTDMDNKLVVETSLRTVPLRDFVAEVVKRDGRPAAKIELAVGLQHPQIFGLVSTAPSAVNYSIGPAILLAALLGLGYDITITKRL